MSGFKTIVKDSVRIDHFSSSSFIKVTIAQKKEQESGSPKLVYTEVWFDYEEFSDLKKAVNLTDDWL